ncbi:2-C-methyl-D-erythritol 4-phosphate cytidylyltransferase, partial [bacterium]|nr:2-C-methyl-D-erythritol 4-phosphate cytidylyltransferase [bacterium]
TAAGSGSRYGSVSNKIFETIHGEPVLIHSLRRLMGPWCSEIIVTAHPNDIGNIAKLTSMFEANIRVIPGGSTRAESVRNALREKSTETRGALIHDAARPNASPALVQRVVTASETCDAVIPAIPVTDTIKRVNLDQVVETVPRSDLVAVQTPQFFSNELIPMLINTTADNLTDESMAIEMAGQPVTVVPGDPANLKLTRPEDLALLTAVWVNL